METDKRKLHRDSNSDSDNAVNPVSKRLRIDGSPPKFGDTPSRRILQSPTPEELSLLSDPGNENKSKIIQTFKFPTTLSAGVNNTASSENLFSSNDLENASDKFFTEIKRREESSQKRLKNPELHKSGESYDSFNYDSDRDGANKSKYRFSSAGNSDLGTSPESIWDSNAVIELCFRAVDVELGKCVFQRTVKSDYKKLEAILKMHNLDTTNYSSSGYAADEEGSETSVLPKSSSRLHSLGSTIPRQSIVSIATTTSEASEKNYKKLTKPVTKSSARRKSSDRDREPIITSTKINDFSFSDPEQSSSEHLRSSTPLSNGDDHLDYKMPKLVKQKSHTSENEEDEDNKNASKSKSDLAAKQKKEKEKVSDKSQTASEKNVPSNSKKKPQTSSKKEKSSSSSTSSSSFSSTTTTTSQSQSGPETPKTSKKEAMKRPLKTSTAEAKPESARSSGKTTSTPKTPTPLSSSSRRLRTPSTTPVPINVSTPGPIHESKQSTSSLQFSTSASVFATPSPLSQSTTMKNSKLESCPPLPEPDLNINAEPVDLNSLVKSTTLWGAIAANELVFARWRDRNYYSGRIKYKGMNDTWVIDFEDNMEDVASETHIIPIKILGVGVSGVYSPDNVYKPANATVIGQKFEEKMDAFDEPVVKYAIKLDNDPTPLWCTRRQLSIKEADARKLRAEFNPSLTGPKPAEVSSDNIVLAPRRNRCFGLRSAGFDESAEESRPRSSKSRSSKLNTTKMAEPKAKVAKLSEDASILDTSKSSNIEIIDTPEVPSASTPQAGTSTTRATKESPRKKPQAKKTGLFEGMQFFLTATSGGDPSSSGYLSTSSIIPYDKDEYRGNIEKQGGKIIDVVGKEKGKTNIFLISDSYARTVKYIYCLAANFPCVSHEWIAECLEKNTVTDWTPYQLEAGWSLEQQCVIPKHSRMPLKNFKIYCISETDELYNYWRPVLTAAQACLLKPKKKSLYLPPDVDVMVTDAGCDPELLALAKERLVPTVKPEWLVQCIIRGEKSDFFGHEKFRVIPMDEESIDE